MTAVLRCDTCGALGAEADNVLPRWWRLERYGEMMAREPGPFLAMPLLPSVSFALSDSDDEPDEPDDVIPTLHFCSAGCLASWAQTAASMEG